MSRLVSAIARCRVLRLLAVLASLTPASAIAQQGRQVECRFLWFDSAARPPELVQVASDEIEVECELKANAISNPSQCFVVGGQLQFFDEPGGKHLATAKIPAGVKRALLVFLPAPKVAAGAAPGLPLRVFVIDDSPKTFPDGGAFVVNFYGKDIRFIIGERRNQLRAGGSHGFARPVKRDPFNMAPMIVQFQQGEDWRTVSESAMRFIPGLRYLVLAYVDPRSGRPRIRTFPDVKPVPEPKES